MANSNVNNPEKQAKPLVSESVDKLIDNKKAEGASEGAHQVQVSAEATQGDVAEVMAGVDKPKEKISERSGESGEKGDVKATTKGDDDDAQASSISGQFAEYTLPRETIMVKKIRVAIKRQIKHELKNAKKFEKNLTNGSAQEYNAAISRVRTLKERLASLLTATSHFLKNMYTNYFTAEGKRKRLDEV